MKDLKKRSIAWTILCVAMLFVSVRAAAWEDDQTCSAAGVAGHWGYSETGTVFSPTGVAVPYSSLGRYTLDRDGNYSGARTATIGGKIQKATFKGKATVNPDCTGKVTIKFFDPSSGNLLNTVVKAVVYVNNETEAHAIVTSVLLPDGVTTVQTVLTTDAKKMFTRDEN